MERSIENRHHRHTGHNLSAALYTSNVAWHMERSELCILFADTHNLIIDKHGGMEVLAAVQNAVTYRGNFIYRRYRAVLLIYHSLKNKLDSLGMVFHILLYFKLLFIGVLLSKRTALKSYALADAFQ